MAGGKLKLPLPKLGGVALWLPVTVLLALGLITSIVDLAGLADKEAARAMDASQRFTIDSATGTITLGKANDKKPDAFDVETPAEPEAATTETPAAETPAAPAEQPDVATPEEAAKPAEPAPAEVKPEAPATKEPAPATKEPAPAAETPKPEPTAPEASTAPHAEAAPDVATPEEAASAAPAPAEPALTPIKLPEGTPTLRTEPITADLTAPAATKDSLVSAPAPEVTEVVDNMQLPKRGDKGVAPSKLYAQPFTRTADQVLVSFVVMDAGLDPQAIGLMMGLPKQISIAYSPYSRGTNYSEHLRAVGHEMWTMLPTMGEQYPADDPGPMGLIARMPAEELVRRTRMVLGSVAGSVGLVLPTDETITLQKDSLSPTLGEITKRGMLLLSSHPSRTIEQITTNQGLAASIRRADLLLDPEPDEAQIRSRLAGVLAAAKEKGEYVVMLSARPQTLQVLIDWLHNNPVAEPFTLAPLSAIYLPKEAAPVAEEAAGGHGAPAKEKKKEKPAEKKKKALPQDKYLQPAGEKKSGGH